MTPNVPDYGHREADKELYALIRRLHLSYRQARISLMEKIEEYMEQFEKEDAMKRALYDSGELSHEEYTRWKYSTLAGTKQWKRMLNQLADDMTHQNEIAASMINDALPDVYALNHNYGTYEAEVGSGYDTTYTLYDKNTVKRLLTEHDDLLPKPRVDIPKDMRWNRQHIQSAVLQGILQGESMGKIAGRMMDVTDMNKKAAMRNARTAVTGAENAGRIDSYVRAQNMGINMKQMWMATLDARTRDSHAIMDGEQQEIGKKFSNGCRYPGDPHGSPGEIWNCRCTLVAMVEGADPYNPNLRPSEYLKEEGLTYEQWKEMHGERFYSKLFKNYEEPNNKQILYPTMMFNGVSKHVANAYENSIQRLCNEFPLRNEKLQSVSDFRTAWNLPSNTDLIDFTDSHIEWEGVGAIFYPTDTKYPNSNIALKGSHIVMYSAEEYDDTPLSDILSQFADIREKYGYNGKENAFFNTGVGIEGAIVHEYGHAIANDCGLYYGQENYNLLKNIFDKYSDDEIMKDISIYATSNPEEMLAEAFVAYHEPRLRTPIVMEIMDLIHSLRS